MEEVYIKEIANGRQKRIKKDVVAMCKLLKKLNKKCKKPEENEDLPDDLKVSLTEHFRDIYWSLKLHLLFHLGVRNDAEPDDDAESDADLELQTVRRLHFVNLTDEENNVLPDQKHAIDPGSKLLEIFSVIAKNSEERNSKHADDVICMAGDWLKTLSSKNIFRPKVLAKVSHNGKWFVGSSIAVSPFLRPQCLHIRIANFKQSLQKAIVFNQPLDTANKTNWSCSAFATGGGGTKPPCKNCETMFGNLEGFVRNTDTFLGACAEYCPVDQLLPVEALSENDKQRIDTALERNGKQCTVLFKNFRDIESKCKEAYKTQDKRQRNEKCKRVYSEIRDKVHIFGLKPECNKYFGGSNCSFV